MDASSIPTALHAALEQHQAGQLDLAEQQYRQILQIDPRNFDAMHLLGVLLYQRGRLSDGAETIRRAIAINPSHPAAHYNLGNALRDQGLLDDASAAYHTAIQLHPGFVEAQNNLSLVLTRLGRAEEAIATALTALKIRPDYTDALTNLGNAFLAADRFEEAAEAHRRVIALQPNYAPGYSNLGDALAARGALDDAVAAYRHAISLNPNLAEPWCNLAAALTSLESFDEALAACDKAIQIKPNLAQAHLNRGNVLWRRADPASAAECYRRSIEIDRNYADAHNNLGNALKDLSRHEEAIECYRTALRLRPDQHSIHSNLLYSMHFASAISSQELFDAHAAWGQSMASLARGARHENDPSPDRRLRIGFVSPDLCSHPVGRFIAPIFDHHDRDRFEFICFTDAPRDDEVSRRLRAAADGWHSILGLRESQVADLIGAQRIDILVDLALHTRRNRLPVFARKPAPVQVSYLGYPGTTGLPAIEYRLTDRYLDPPGSTARYTERPLFLSGSYWCYEIPADVPAVEQSPVLRSGFITFGCLNNLCKISDTSLQACTRIISLIPGARLILHAPPGDCRDRVREMFAHDTQIEFVAYQTQSQYFQTYGRIDIALDPFPYNGGTTTCDALAMGVPVITLAGNTATARAGASILSNANLPQLVTKSIDDYVKLACEMAGNPPHLSATRAEMREQLLRSPLTDAKACALAFEDALRGAWRNWCADVSAKHRT